VESLRKAVDEVFKPNYKENIRKIKQLVYDQPMTSREKATWWIEYVIRNGNAEELKYPGRKIKFYKICGFDIIFVVFLGIFVLLKIFKKIKIFKDIKKLKNE
jgi:glucuronosyltransferase